MQCTSDINRPVKQTLMVFFGNIIGPKESPHEETWSKKDVDKTIKIPGLADDIFQESTFQAVLTCSFTYLPLFIIFFFAIRRCLVKLNFDACVSPNASGRARLPVPI